MKAGVLEREMASYFMRLNEAEKRSVLAMIKTFIQSRENNNTVDIDEYNDEIDAAMAGVEKGEFYTHEEVVAMSKNW